MHTVSYGFLIKPEGSSECHQTLLSCGVWARD